MSNDRKTIIELSNVSKAFGDLRVLEGIDLSISRGDTTVVIGESGTGKSVLLKTIIGLLRPDSGRVFFDGADITELRERDLTEVRKHFGFLFQAGALFDSMTVGENVGFPVAQHTRNTAQEIREIALSKLRLVGLEDLYDRMPSEISGGQRKRVALARAIALEPQVVLYDEPTTGLDPIRADVIDELILKLKEAIGVTSIVVTHNMKSAYKVADRVLMLYNGQFIFDGSADQLKQSDNPRVKSFVLGQADQSDLEKLGIVMR